MRPTLFERIRDVFSPPVRTDAVFGTMRFRRGVWTCHVVLPGLNRPVEVDVFAGQDGPTEGQRELFQVLPRCFEELRRQMAAPLFDEYQTLRAMHKAATDFSVPGAEDDFAVDFPAVESPAEIWRVATLSRIELFGQEEIEFSFDHRINWADDDHELNVRVKNWRVLEVAYEG